ncbi:2-oxo acid dehydrogenase subunit E2 [Cryptosporangium arvum]|uniref:Dihydrolipoamide acetyltransferase component of pyruvate dehydrogenase complex n=1 Tax=Cryptosporangium arvum DSM 44712 TaxID=927661 RepID=A0A011ALB6_9ACTN|nr:2-oxo acid dehydrogenase subunit E2 [Cryptosporangium arvum]EXG82726.1 pyruvate/2-oxoglutarate dehydrogenase complex, dihydrolipoamide acyltransferase component [Cryptosporangium arvum DSM 44712]
MTEIRIPRLNSNDTEYTLVEWLVATGEPVRPGDLVATVETSKATEDLTCAGAGVLQHLVAAGTECAVGEVIATVLPVGTRVSASPAGVSPAGVSPAGVSPAGVSPAEVEPIITEPARRAMAERGIGLAAVRALGRPVIRVADLDALDPAGPGRVEPLSSVQQAVAAVVSDSHRSVPAGFVAIEVPVDAALHQARELTRTHRCLIGLTELVIAALGTVAERFPQCFGAYVEPGAVRLPDRVDVGVTIDIGLGLHVPVIRDAAAKPVAVIAKELMAHRLTAMRGSFRATDLTGANVLLALHTDDGVTTAVPIVLPGTVCAVSLAGVRPVLRLDADGAPVTHTVVSLGVAYDHRVVNGAKAVEFLRAVREVLLAPVR